MLKSQTVAEKMAKKFRGPLFSAAPCIGGVFGNCEHSCCCVALLTYILIYTIFSGHI